MKDESITHPLNVLSCGGNETPDNSSSPGTGSVLVDSSAPVSNCKLGTNGWGVQWNEITLNQGPPEYNELFWGCGFSTLVWIHAGNHAKHLGTNFFLFSLWTFALSDLHYDGVINIEMKYWLLVLIHPQLVRDHTGPLLPHTAAETQADGGCECFQELNPLEWLFS